MADPDDVGSRAWLKWCFVVVLVINGLLIWRIGTFEHTGSDAAGNSMADGFAFLLAIAASIVLGALALIFKFAKAMWARAFLALLGLSLAGLLLILSP